MSDTRGSLLSDPSFESIGRRRGGGKGPSSPDTIKVLLAVGCLLVAAIALSIYLLRPFERIPQAAALSPDEVRQMEEDKRRNEELVREGRVINAGS